MYMSPWMSDELAALEELTADFIAKEALPRHAQWVLDKRIGRDFWEAAGEIGLLGCSVPTEFGGGGATVLHDFVVLAAMTRAGLTASSLQVHSVIMPHYLVRYGSPEQKKRWLPDLCAGRAIGALAMTEPDVGTDLQALRTRAVRDGDDYVISGSKTFITNGTTADLVIVAATTDPSKKAHGITLFAVETANSPGFRVGCALHKIGQHESDTAELFFDGVRVPAANRLGAEGQGWGMLMGQLPLERLIVGVNSVAAMETAVDLATEYANERRAFGRPLIDKQHVRFELAECATLAHVARTFLDSCIVRLLDGTLDSTVAPMAKWWLSEVECQVVDRCLQIFGGYGYMQEYPIARLYVNARVQKIYGGTNEIMKEVIGRGLVKSS
jgi:acyl-CoA dehydrogenase